MARNSPEKLAQALRANLRRRKTASAEAAPREGAPEAAKAPESPPEKPRPAEG
jgi:hypothetical protein